MRHRSDKQRLGHASFNVGGVFISFACRNRISEQYNSWDYYRLLKNCCGGREEFYSSFRVSHHRSSCRVFKVPRVEINSNTHTRQGALLEQSRRFFGGVIGEKSCGETLEVEIHEKSLALAVAGALRKTINTNTLHAMTHIIPPPVAHEGTQVYYLRTAYPDSSRVPFFDGLGNGVQTSSHPRKIPQQSKGQSPNRILNFLSSYRANICARKSALWGLRSDRILDTSISMISATEHLNHSSLLVNSMRWILEETTSLLRYPSPVL